MGETERAVFSVHINGSKEAVWQVPGNRYQMRSPDGRTVNTIGEVLECDPPNLLKQTRRLAQMDDPECTITFEIVDAAQGGVDLTLIVETGKVGLSTRLMYRFFDILGPVAQPNEPGPRTGPWTAKKATDLNAEEAFRRLETR